MKLLIIGNPENRRVTMFCEAAFSLGHTATCHSYLDWLNGDVPNLTAFDGVKIESPGENSTVEQRLVKLGNPDAEHVEDFGRIQNLAAWYQGYIALLDTLPVGKFFSTPSAIASMFDKEKTYDTLRKIAPVPERFTASSLQDLRQQKPRGRYFIKPRFGSSASGVIALSVHEKGCIAHTSIEIDGDRYYNQLQTKTYREESQIEAIVDFIIDSGAVIERWVPKSMIDDRSFDLRIVCIDQKPKHTVVRSSSGPITNLHLGNRRGLLSQLSETNRNTLNDAAGQAASAFPDALYCGVDVAVTPKGRPVVFEVNAFGDLLPDVLVDGEDTYTAQIRAFQRR